MWTRLIVCLLCYLPAQASAAIVFEFESTCTVLFRNMDCAFFGLDGGDPVTGGFIVEDQFGAPGTISFLSNEQ